LTYRHGVRELAYSRGVPLVQQLAAAGATVLAYDPLLEPADVQRLGARPWAWADGAAGPAVRAVVTQTGDPRWRELDWAWFVGLELVYDGRNSLDAADLPAGVRYVGVGVPDRAVAGVAGA
ncbi:MAG TPA: UDP binding domain-containing protein, partial [Candidatus Binatus sp.]|nr:UDP binding domain-containing protein [Candidatus Binatus sp.]